MDAAGLLPEVRAGLVELLHDLDGGDWDRATACPGWTVADVARHLVGVELGNVSRRRDGHRVDPGPAWRSDVPDPVESEELRTLVRNSIERLPEVHRNVLWLRDIEGLSTEEAARMLEVEPATLKVRLHRARQALRTLLHPHLTGRAA